MTKGKSVVDLGQACAPSSLSSLETMPLIDSEGIGKQLPSGKILTGSEVVLLDTITPGLHAVSKTLSLVPNLGKPLAGSTYPGGDSIVTCIKWVENYATNVHGEGLKETNQFAILGHVTDEGDNEGEDGDLGPHEVEFQRTLKASVRPREPLEHSPSISISTQNSVQGKYSKNKPQCSSSMQSLSPRRY